MKEKENYDSGDAYTCTPEYNRSACGAVSVLPATSRNSATGAVPAKTSPGKRLPVSAMKALTITKTQKRDYQIFSDSLFFTL